MHSIPYIELSRAEVTNWACRFWKAAGGPTGHDLEYWLQAEGQLLTTAEAARAPNENSGAATLQTFSDADTGLRLNGATRVKMPVRE